MAEPITAVAIAVAAPAMDALSRLISALKEPMGKRRMEDLKTELRAGLEEVRGVFDDQNGKLATIEGRLRVLEGTVAHLNARIAYLELPFWKRWLRRPKTTDLAR